MAKRRQLAPNRHVEDRHNRDGENHLGIAESNFSQLLLNILHKVNAKRLFWYLVNGSDMKELCRLNTMKNLYLDSILPVKL